MLASTWFIRFFSLALVKFLSRAFTALNLRPQGLELASGVQSGVLMNLRQILFGIAGELASSCPEWAGVRILVRRTSGATMTDSVLTVGRILMSAIFIFGGLTKLIGAAASQAMMARYGLPMPMLAWAITVIIELGGGLALLFGVATRPTATVLGLWCIATALVAHTNFADPNMRGHFMKNVAMAGGFAYVAVFGAGAYSIDAWRKRRASA